MKLDDFLKVKKVRCVEGNYSHGLIRDKVYDVISTEYNEFFGKLFIKIDKNGIGTSYLSDFFEPVLDPAENPLQEMKLTPELEAVEPTFKVGDKVYFGLSKNIEEIERFLDLLDGIYAKSKSGNLCPLKACCHATPENYERLQATFTDIEFEPPKPLTGTELAKKLIAKGHNYLVVDTVIGIRVLTRLEGNTLIDSNNVRLDELDDITPLNDETGEPLTEAVLDE